ncbi:MAG: UDP-N-acetylglucosamine 2-epimerase (hydrolyzing) [Alphaproteobacteria bacterium]|nr:UDP-N-acetylglucosamine 2-epimerase (hydrolyzing) [Alphaproteobacteria bacterium]
MRRICIVTGSRADYGLLTGLMREISADAAMELQVVATGSHLSAAFGHTVDAIRADGFKVDAEVSLPLGDDSRLAVAHATGQALSGMAQAFERLKPNLVVVLGDRYEIFAAASAALLLGIPVAHIHGGELTLGAVDDALRHAITKMASLHFVAAHEYARRVLQMGEPADRVFEVGAPGVDLIGGLSFQGAETLGRDLGLPLFNPLLLVTYHPVTRRTGDEGAALDELLSALERLPDARIVITGVNADAGNQVISGRMSAFASAHPDRVSLHSSLGQERYLSVMRLAGAVVGNSSSGIIEAPALGIPTVNIGARQNGRLKAYSVIDCDEDAEAIFKAIKKALGDGFRASIAGQPLPYGHGGAARMMKDVLKTYPADQLADPKPFHDIIGRL